MAASHSITGKLTVCSCSLAISQGKPVPTGSLHCTVANADADAHSSHVAVEIDEGSVDRKGVLSSFDPSVGRTWQQACLGIESKPGNQLYHVGYCN